MLRKKNSKAALLSLLLLVNASLSAHGASSLKEEQSRTEQDDDATIVIRLPQHSQFTISTAASSKPSKYRIKYPARMELLREKLDSSKNRRYPGRGTINLPQFLPIFPSGFAILAMGSLFFTENGKKELMEFTMGSISALALVWIPTWLLQGSLPEILSLAALFTRPYTRSIIVKDLIPRAWKALKKLFLAEAWRQLWAVVLAPFPSPSLSPTDADIMRMRQLPQWMKEGFLLFRDKVDKLVVTSFKTFVRKTAEGSTGILYQEGTWNNMEEEGSSSSPTEADNDDAIAGNAGDGDESQMVCDGDVCWME